MTNSAFARNFLFSALIVFLVAFTVVSLASKNPWGAERSVIETVKFSKPDFDFQRSSLKIKDIHRWTTTQLDHQVTLSFILGLSANEARSLAHQQWLRTNLASKDSPSPYESEFSAKTECDPKLKPQMIVTALMAYMLFPINERLTIGTCSKAQVAFWKTEAFLYQPTSGLTVRIEIQERKKEPAESLARSVLTNLSAATAPWLSLSRSTEMRAE